MGCFVVAEFLLTSESRGPSAIAEPLVNIAAVAILDFWNREILLAIGVERIETHRHAKFRHNRSIGCEDIKIFRFFKMAAAVIWNCWICKILLADGVWRMQTHYCTKFPQSHHSVAEILWFFEFSKWPPPAWILKSRNFIGYLDGDSRDASACQISL